MTVFENIKSMNIDEFTEWFDENCVHDNDPCIKWFDETYCKNCETILKDGREYAYCELNDNCKYSNDGMYESSRKHTIKMWLESEIN